MILYRTFFLSSHFWLDRIYISHHINFQGEERKIHRFWYRLSFLRSFLFIDFSEYPAGTRFPDGARMISQVAFVVV